MKTFVLKARGPNRKMLRLFSTNPVGGAHALVSTEGNQRYLSGTLIGTQHSPNRVTPFVQSEKEIISIALLPVTSPKKSPF